MRLAVAFILAAAGGARADDGWWALPVDRATVRTEAISESDRPYSTPARPRDLVGVIALSCEHDEGRPCGDGEGMITELDSSAGYSHYLRANIRLRATTGTGGYADSFTVDRAYLTANLDPFQLEAGRDIVSIGPAGAHTQLAWGDNAPPIDHLLVQTLRPIRLSDALGFGAGYFVGQKRDDSQQHPPLVTSARAMLRIDKRVDVALHQELMLGGDGVPAFGPWDFIAEHVTRRDATASATDSSNRRFGGDVTVYFRGRRIYYQLVFEDIRRHVFDAIHYDADHLIGYASRDVTAEIQRTGVRSYEHVPTITEFTNAGRVVGSPLGPGAFSVYDEYRLRVGGYRITPWIELASLSSSTYSFIDHGPIVPQTAGLNEGRTRLGLRARTALTRELSAEAAVAYEHVTNFAFVDGATRNNAGLVLTITWQPR